MERLLVSMMLFVLAGCGPQHQAVVHSAGEKVLLIDALPRQSYSASTHMGLLPSTEIVPLGTDWGISSEIVADTAGFLRSEGYRVEILEPLKSAERTEHLDSPIPYFDYIHFYYPQWTARFRNWIKDSLNEKAASEAIILSTYGREIYSKGPPYTAYGVRNVDGLKFYEDTAYFYSLVNVNVISLADTKLDYFVMLHLDRVCEQEPPQEIIEHIRKGPLNPTDLAPYKDVIKRLGLSHVRQELVAAGLLKDDGQKCPSSIASRNK